MPGSPVTLKARVSLGVSLPWTLSWLNVETEFFFALKLTRLLGLLLRSSVRGFLAGSLFFLSGNLGELKREPTLTFLEYFKCNGLSTNVCLSSLEILSILFKAQVLINYVVYVRRFI